MKLLILFNAFAGHKKARRYMDKIQDFLELKGAEAEFLLTDYAWHGMDLISERDLTPYDAVVIAGGDGTIFEMINGYMRNPGVHKPPIGVLPMGTGNAFSRDLDLMNFEWEKALGYILSGKHCPVDVARFVTEGKTYYFMNILGFGFVSDVNATSRYLKIFGNAAYTIGTFWELALMKTFALKLDLDGTIVERDNFFVEIANTRYTGSTFIMAPDARFDDGFLDVVLLNRTSRLRVLKLFPTIYKGEHILADEVEVFKAKKIKVFTDQPKILTPDGELMGSTPIEIECLHHAVQVFCP